MGNQLVRYAKQYVEQYTTLNDEEEEGKNLN